jgi:hypothetical protein
MADIISGLRTDQAETVVVSNMHAREQRALETSHHTNGVEVYIKPNMPTSEIKVPSSLSFEIADGLWQISSRTSFQIYRFGRLQTI